MKPESSPLLKSVPNVELPKREQDVNSTCSKPSPGATGAFAPVASHPPVRSSKEGAHHGLETYSGYEPIYSVAKLRTACGRSPAKIIAHPHLAARRHRASHPITRKTHVLGTRASHPITRKNARDGDPGPRRLNLSLPGESAVAVFGRLTVEVTETFATRANA